MTSSHSSTLEARDARPTVLVIGETISSKLTEIEVGLSLDCRAIPMANIAEAIDYLNHGGEPPVLMVMAQSWPGRVTEMEVNGLRQRAPLARVCRLLGPWCEGEGRTGKAVSGTARTYWHQWQVRTAHDVSRHRTGLCPTWGFPDTTTDEERFLSSSERPAVEARGMLLIYASRMEPADALADACRSRGYSAVAAHEAMSAVSDPPCGILWDIGPGEAIDAAAVERVRAICGSAPIVALMNFPREHDRDCLRTLGVSSVLAKPYVLDDLFWEIERLRERPVQ